MKNLRKFLVFVLFALATVAAFGFSGVKAEDSNYTYTFTATTFTANESKDLGNVSWTVAGDGGYWGFDSQNGKGQQFGSGKKPYKSLTISTSQIPGTIKEIKLSTSGASSIVGSFTVTVGGTQYGNTTTLTTTNTEYTFSGSSSGEIVFAYTQTSSKAIYVKSISVTYELSGDVTQLEAPQNVVINNGVMSWDAVEGATAYSVSLDSKVVAEALTETSFDLDALGVYGTHEVSVVALGNGESVLDSQATLSDYYHKYTFVYETKYAYINYDEVYANASASSTEEFVGRVYIKDVYNTTYGNCNVMDDEGNEFIVYGLYTIDGTKYNAMDASIKPQAGDEIVVKGQVSVYSNKGQFKNATLLQVNDKCLEPITVGFQVAEAENGAQHIRLVGGLNVNYEELTALSLTITDATDATKTVTLEITNVFGTLVANTENGIAEITAESQGFESLFAFTITNVPAGTTLNVTATYTTETATYTSAVKTVAVPAAE